MRACGWQLIGVRFGRGRFEGVSFLQKNGLKRTLFEPRKTHFSARKPHFPTTSLIFSPASPNFRPKASFFRLQASFSARHAPLSRLISPHERRSRNMMARIVGARPPPFRLNSLHERRSRNMTARIGGRELAISARQQRNRRRTCSFWPFPLTIPPK